jgi:hypothetical protein
VHFAPPPGGSPKIECHRFSPYFTEKERWLKDWQPAAWYQGLFPSDQIDLSRVAYYFDAQWKDTLDSEVYDEVVAAVIQWIRIWRDAKELPRLSYRFTADGELFIEDTRWGRSIIFTFNAAQASVYQAIDSPITFKQLRKKLQGTPAEHLSPTEVQEILQQFIDAKLALYDEPFYLSLAIADSAIDPPYEFRRRQFAKEPANQFSEKKQKATLMVKS